MSPASTLRRSGNDVRGSELERRAYLPKGSVAMLMDTGLLPPTRSSSGYLLRPADVGRVRHDLPVGFGGAADRKDNEPRELAGCTRESRDPARRGA